VFVLVDVVVEVCVVVAVQMVRTRFSRMLRFSESGSAFGPALGHAKAWPAIKARIMCENLIFLVTR
jgi:hypothetical protein